MSAEPAIEVLALAGIPEIRIGDDLGDIITNAIARTPGAGPLTVDLDTPEDLVFVEAAETDRLGVG